MILSKLIESISGNVSVIGNTNRIITGVCYDSRKFIQNKVIENDKINSKEEIIFAVINDTDDTAINYVQNALNNGCRVLITDNFEHESFKYIHEISDKKTGSLYDEITLIIVENARRAMSEVAFALRDNPQNKLQFFGITGTNGKTTIAYLLRQLLEQNGIQTALIGTLGVLIDNDFTPTGYTTPESPELAEILELAYNKGCKAVVMEVSSHALALHRVWGINYDGAIFSNLTLDHLDFHKTFEEYFNAKAKLFQSLRSDALAVINIDDQYGDNLVDKCQSRIITYGKENSFVKSSANFLADDLEKKERNYLNNNKYLSLSRAENNCIIDDIKLETSGSNFSLTFQDTNINRASEENTNFEKIIFQTSLVGEFNVYNIAAVVSLVKGLGFNLQDISSQVASLQAVAGRMQTYITKQNVNVIIDYAHTPDALENVLKNVISIKNEEAKIILVFGCGGNRDISKRPTMGSIAESNADMVIITSDNPRNEEPSKIIDDIKTGIKNKDSKNIFVIIDRKAAINKALQIAQNNDVVIIAGKGHENYQLIGEQKLYFSDLEQVVEIDNS